MRASALRINAKCSVRKIGSDSNMHCVGLDSSYVIWVSCLLVHDVESHDLNFLAEIDEHILACRNRVACIDGYLGREISVDQFASI